MQPKLTPIYAVQAITGFAGSLVGIFIPIYLLTLGFNVRNIMVYSLLQAIFGFVFSLSTGWLSARVSLKLLMLARVPFIIALLILLIAAKTHPVSLTLLAALEAAHFSLYYIPLHVFFTAATSKESVGRQVGAFFAWPKVANIIAPVLAGFVAAKWGFTPIFAAAAVLYAASSIPMTAIAPYHAPLHFNFAKFLELYARYRTYFWLEIVENVQEELDLVIWPLVVFLTLQSTLQVGLVGTLISGGSALFTYLVGRSHGRVDKFRLLRLGGISGLILWLWRLGTITPLMAFSVSALVGFSEVLVSIPFNSIIYNLARDNNPREFIMFREVPIVMARILVYVLGIALATNLHRLFWLAIAAYAVFAVMPRFNTSPVATKKAAA